MEDTVRPKLLPRDKAILGLALVLPTLVTLAYFVLAASASAAVQQTIYGIAKSFQFLLPIVWVTGIQKHWPRWKQFSWRGIGFGFSFGLAVGLVMLGMHFRVLRNMDFFLAALEKMQAKIAGMNLTSPVLFAAVGIFYSLFHSLLEEYYWRWFVFGQLRRSCSLVPAIVISSLGFMAHHVLVIGTYFGFVSLWTWLFSLSVALGGAVWAWLYDRTGTLWGPWVSHLLIDAAIFTIGYEIAAQIPAN